GINACTTANCICSGTTVICNRRQLTSVPDGIEANATRLMHVPVICLCLFFCRMLSRNRLIAIDGSDFSGLTELERLELDNNEIVSITADAFQDLISLKIIFLNDNQITSLPSGLFSANVILQNVYVYDNNLTTVSADVFQAITLITTMKVRDPEMEQSISRKSRRKASL
ncbi:Hypothetical predicted protein, partial [Mytilus galloprovincialis]